MSLHDDLLALARELTEREAGKPRQASLRRAVSSAYYALFHLFVHEGTAALVRGTGRTALRHCLGRAFGHGDMGTVAETFARNKVSEKILPALGGKLLPPQLITVARAFVDLQQARNEADYNTSHRLTREECIAFVEQADAAFKDWRAVRSSVPADVFLVALLAQRQMRG